MRSCLKRIFISLVYRSLAVDTNTTDLAETLNLVEGFFSQQLILVSYLNFTPTFSRFCTSEQRQHPYVSRMHWPYVRQIEARVRADELVVEIFVYESGLSAKSIVYNIARFAQMVGMMIKTFRRTVEITDGRTAMIGRYVSGNLRPLLTHWVAVVLPSLHLFFNS